MNTTLMHETLTGSLAGNLTFPQVVGKLIEAGVESYRVDFITGQDVFYAPSGATHTETFPVDPTRVASTFNQPALQQAIREAQADTLRYPQFVPRVCAAGVASYQVFITGRKAIYFGRNGETHTEPFPASSN